MSMKTRKHLYDTQMSTGDYIFKLGNTQIRGPSKFTPEIHIIEFAWTLPDGRPFVKPIRYRHAVTLHYDYISKADIDIIHNFYNTLLYTTGNVKTTATFPFPGVIGSATFNVILPTPLKYPVEFATGDRGIIYYKNFELFLNEYDGNDLTHYVPV